MTVSREFTNELGNRIKITIEGPNSTSENILTPYEAEQALQALEEAIHGIGCNHFRECDCAPTLSDLELAFVRAGWARPETITDLEAQLAAARASEREACAAIADTGHLVPPDGGSPTEAEHEIARYIAAAIRSREKGEG